MQIQLQMYEAYDKRMRDNGKMDYDDQMIYAAAILRKYPSILSYYRDRFRYICVDEAQDTSRLQHAVIRLIADCGANLFMVGDVKQAIYRFRLALHNLRTGKIVWEGTETIAKGKGVAK